MNHKLLIYLICVGILIFCTAMAVYIYKWEYRKPLFEVHFFSLKRGRAIFIRGPDHKTILVGGGQNSEIIRELTKVTPFYSREIDYVFIPSTTPAQIGGLIEVLDRYDIGKIYIPDPIATSTVLDQLMKKIKSKKIHITRVKKGDSLSLGTLYAEILFPYNDFKYNKSSLPELGLEIDYDNTSLYLMGNLSKTIQKDVSKSLADSGDENLLEFYNSASKAKVSNELIEKVKPKYTFTTKEKSTVWVSGGFSWDKI